MKHNGDTYLLCTRPLPDNIRERATDAGINLDCISFIETKPRTGKAEAVLEVAKLRTAVIFTSMNAVEAVRNMLGNIEPEWNIYAIGGQTSRQAALLFPNSVIVTDAPYGKELAEKLIADNPVSPIHFFSGNLRRKEIPAMLAANYFRLHETVVYETYFTPQKTTALYDGILFFSPSAVESYFSVNEALPQQHFFAIGTTTAAAIREYTDRPVIISNSPDKEMLVEQAIEFYTQQKIHK